MRGTRRITYLRSSSVVFSTAESAHRHDESVRKGTSRATCPLGGRLQCRVREPTGCDGADGVGSGGEGPARGPRQCGRPPDHRF